MQVTQAKNLSSGDAALFPRKGVLKVRRLAGKHALGISLIFDDGKMQHFKAEKLVTITERRESEQSAGAGKLYRQDLQTGRTSIISVFAFHSGFPDVSNSFKAMRGRVCEMDSSAALAEMEPETVLYTTSEIYWTPVPCWKCGREAWRSFVRGISHGIRSQLCCSCAEGMLEWLAEGEGTDVLSD